MHKNRFCSSFKKLKAYFKSHNFSILKNRMNEKAGFEIVLKSQKHVTYVAVRTISMITISMITIQN